MRIRLTAGLVFRIVVIYVRRIIVLEGNRSVFRYRPLYCFNTQLGVVLVFGNVNGAFKPVFGIFKGIDGSGFSADGAPPERKEGCYLRRIPRRRGEISRDVFAIGVSERDRCAV